MQGSLFSPSALCTDGNNQVVKLDNDYVQLFTFPRITRDGRQLILACSAGIEGSSDDATDIDPCLLGILHKLINGYAKHS